MLTDQHAQSPGDDPPSLSRRDHRIPAAGRDGHHPCDCGGCLEFRALHTGLTPELPLFERLTKRAHDRAAQLRYAESDSHQPTQLAA
jgi:hypothetical protein